MSATYTHYSFQLVDIRTNRAIEDSTGKFAVLTADTPDRATAYNNEFGTALTQPGTLAKGWGQFWAASDVATVDLIVLTATGHFHLLRGLTPSQHRINIDSERINYMMHLPFTTSLSGVNYDTGFVTTQNMLIKSARIRVTTLDGTATLGVGNTTVGMGGYILGAIMTATGYRLLNESLSGAECVGSALAVTATNFAVRKFLIPANATSALGILYTNATASGGTAAPAKGFIILEYERLVTN